MTAPSEYLSGLCRRCGQRAGPGEPGGSIPGVIAIFVNHHQGPELLRGAPPRRPHTERLAAVAEERDSERLSEQRTDLAAAVGIATDQAGRAGGRGEPGGQLSKIDMKNRSLVAFCNGVNVVHLNHHPLVLTFVAEEVGPAVCAGRSGGRMRRSA